MYLYVDETECPEYFIVTGLLFNSKEDLELAYKRFRKKAQDVKLSQKQKSILFTEFKSTLLDNDYQNLKTDMLRELNRFQYRVICSCHIKRGSVFGQKTKERIYINLLSRIVLSIEGECEVVFDSFNKKRILNPRYSKS